MSRPVENVEVEGQGIQRVSVLRKEIAIGFSGKNFLLGKFFKDIIEF